MRSCNNCHTEFDSNFCPNCGQRPNSGRIVFKESVKDVLEHYFDFDAPLFRTIKRMITNPGTLIREYIFGKRKSYSHPFRYFILVLAVYLIVVQLIDFNPVEVFSKAMGAREMPNPDAVSSKAANFLREHINTFLLIYAFTLALFGKILNRKSGFYFVEYLSLSFFVVAQYLFFSLFIILLTLLSPKIFLVNYLVAFFYPIYVLVKFHEGNLFIRISKALLVSILGWLTYVIISFAISFFIVAQFML